MKKEISRLLKQHAGVKIDLGCGPNKQGADWIGVDFRPGPRTDIVCDLEVFPWPIPTSCAHSVVMSHIWEHIKPWLTLKFMAELHRICRNDAQVFIAGPYGVEGRYLQDPTHCNPSVESTFYYWDTFSTLWNVYQPPVFHVLEFARVPMDFSADFNAVLACCKPKKGRVCEHKPS